MLPNLKLPRPKAKLTWLKFAVLPFWFTDNGLAGSEANFALLDGGEVVTLWPTADINKV